MNKVSEHKNILPMRLIEKMHAHVVNESSNYSWRPNNINWNYEIIEGSVPIMTMDMSPFREELHSSISAFVPEVDTMDLFIPFPTFYSMPPLSHIGWHEDYTPINVSIYLNEVWDKRWGGFFVHEKDDGTHGAIIPEFNKAVVMRSGVSHCVSMIPPYTPVHRFSIQLFFAEKGREYQSRM